MIINGKQFVVVMDGENYHCAMDIVMKYLGGKWILVILWHLRNGTKRFSELARIIPQITEKMLSLQLKQLEEHGLVERTVYMEMPMRVEYSLTEFGETLIPALDGLAGWGRALGKARGKIVEFHPKEEIKRDASAAETATA